MKTIEATCLCIIIIFAIGLPIYFPSEVDADSIILAGHITTDTTWTVEESPYIIQGDIFVDEGVTLTIEPGVEIKFDGSYGFYINGNLTAVGSEDNKIIFTSNKTNPAPLDWRRIQINPSGKADIRFCDISYGHILIYLYSSYNNIANCTMRGFETAIQLDYFDYNYSESNNIYGCYLERLGIGSNVIRLIKSDFNNITNCIIINGSSGLELGSSSCNRIMDNTFINCKKNLQIWGDVKSHYDNFIPTSNKGDGKSINYFFNQHHQTLFSQNSAHVTIAYSDNITVENSIINPDGITIVGTKDAFVNSCKMENYGISISNSFNINVSNCNISNCYGSIGINEAQHINLAGNDIWDSRGMALDVNGDLNSPEDYNHIITSSNRINGRPFYYYYNQSDDIISDIETGGIFFVFCNNISLNRCRIIDGDPLSIEFSQSIIVDNSEIIGTYHDSPYVYKNGIMLRNSNNNQITNCTISNLDTSGIHFSESSSNNTISNNIIKNTDYPIYFYPLKNKICSNNKIYHNNFINNIATPNDWLGGNYWDNGYPDGGNFWSDYIGEDKFSGPNQDILGSDGIGDTPYQNIYANSTMKEQGWATDNYPLMKHVGWETSPPVITSVVVTNITDHSAIISWRTDENSDSRVNFSLNSDLSSSSTIYDPEMVTDHSLDLVDLKSNTTYFFKVISVDEQNDTAIDDNNMKYYIFTTELDVIPPTIKLVSPVNDTIIRPGTIIDLNISNYNLDVVNYSINNGLNQTLIFPFNISTIGWIDDVYWIEIHATDTSGNTAVKLLKFQIDGTAPIIISTFPMNNTIKIFVDTNLLIEFNESMNTTSVENAISFTPEVNISAFNWNNNKTELTISLLNELEYNTTYIIIIGSNTSDVVGNPMGIDYLWVFMTQEISEDSDEDGLPDNWEIEHFGDLLWDGDDDPDRDGYSNYEEYLGNTDPDDSKSYPTKPSKESSLIQDYWWLIVIIVVIIIIVVYLIYIKKRKASVNIEQREKDSLPPPY